jgi:hypothetical protein
MAAMDWPYLDRPGAVCWSLVDGRWWRVDGGTEIAMRVSCARRIEAARGVVTEWNQWGRTAPDARFEVTVYSRQHRTAPYVPPAMPS